MITLAKPKFKILLGCSYKIFRNNSSQVSKSQINIKIPNYIDLKKTWPNNELNSLIEDMKVIPNFISEDEETNFLDELEPYLKRMKYEFDHWDDAIHGFRETERKHWYPKNKDVVERIRALAFADVTIPYIHVLDLEEKGLIKPHVDSTRYCGSTIAGISLLSDCVMRLIRVDEKKYQQNNSDDYRAQPNDEDKNNKLYDYYADILLNRRSLYIMKNTARYNFTHEILSNDIAIFNGKPIKKTRRISIICRNEP